MVKGMRLFELVAAVIALVTRMRDINTELTKRLVDLRRRRPRSETLARVECQLVLAEIGRADGQDRALESRRRPFDAGVD